MAQSRACEVVSPVDIADSWLPHRRAVPVGSSVPLTVFLSPPRETLESDVGALKWTLLNVEVTGFAQARVFVIFSI